MMNAYFGIIICTAGDDFEARDINVTFPVDVTEVTVEIKVINDDILESYENFSLLLQPVPGVFPLAVVNKMLTVQIIDNDGKKKG